MLFNSNNYLEAVGINSILGILVLNLEAFWITNEKISKSCFIFSDMEEAEKIEEEMCEEERWRSLYHVSKLFGKTKTTWFTEWKQNFDGVYKIPPLLNGKVT